MELRRYARVPFAVDVEFVAKGRDQKQPGRSQDISLGGMFISTSSPLAFKAELTVYLTMPGEHAPFALPAVVRWTRPDGMGVQFGNIGARETFAITEYTRQGSGD